MIDWEKCPPVGCNIEMIMRTRARLVPFVLCAMGIISFVLPGCRKEEKAPEIPASSPASYMNDRKFIGELAAERAEQSRLIVARNEISRKMVAMIEAKKEELKTDDLKIVRAELEKDAVWRELHTQCTNANAQVAKQRGELLGKVRARIAPKGETRRDAASTGKDISK